MSRIDIFIRDLCCTFTAAFTAAIGTCYYDGIIRFLLVSGGMLIFMISKPFSKRGYAGRAYYQTLEGENYLSFDFKAPKDELFLNDYLIFEVLNLEDAKKEAK